MKTKRRLVSGLLCVVLAMILTVPALAHGGRGHGRHHSGYAQSVQTSIAVCPFEDCSLSGRHIHGDVIYCGYGHEGGLCDGSCAVAVSRCHGGCHGHC